MQTSAAHQPKGVQRRAWWPGLLWTGALLLTAPALVQFWTFGGLRLDGSLWRLVAGALAAHGALRAEVVVAAAYLLCCVVLWLAFVLRCDVKRYVILALAALGLGQSLWWDALGMAHVLTALAMLSAAAVLVEVWRQNKPLLSDLRASRVRWAGLLGQTLWLWSPALLLISMGLYWSALLSSASINAIYASGTVQAYCQQGQGDGALTAACQQFEPPAASQQVAELSLSRAVEHNLDESVWSASQHLLQATAEPTQWATPATSTAALNHYLALVRQTLVPVVLSASDSLSNLVRDDAELQRLINRKAQLQQLSRPPQPPALLFGGMAHAAALLKWSLQQKDRDRELGDVNWRIAARTLRLTQEFAAGDPSVRMKRALHDQLSARLNLDVEDKTARARLAAAWSGKPVKGSNTIRATVRAELLRILATSKAEAAQVRSAVFAADPAMAVQAGWHQRRCLYTLDDEQPELDRIDACPQDAAARPAGPPRATAQALPFVDSVKLSLDAWAARAEREIEQGLQEANVAALSAGRQTERSASALYSTTPGSLGLKRDRHCGINPFCHAMNVAKGQAESAYRDARADLEHRFKRSVQRNATLGVMSAQEQIDAARDALHADLQASHAAARRAVEDLQRGFELVSTVLTVFLVFAALKSFLYVVALKIFHESGAADVGFAVPPGPEGDYLLDTSISVPAGLPVSLHTFALGLNQTRRLVLWKPWVAFFSRLPRLRFLMNHGSHATQGAIKFALGPGLTGVRWRMHAGEQVVFSFRDLLGFSDNVHIRTEVSLRLSTLLLGTYFFRVAECVDGDGLLLLSIRGSGGAEGDQVEMVSVATLKAWNLHTRFRVFGSQTLASVFKDGFTLIRRDAGQAGRGKILAGATRNGELSIEGLVWYAKTFLMPI